MTPYDDIGLGQHWLRKWVSAWRDQTITWTNVDSSSLASISVRFHRKCANYIGKNYHLIILKMFILIPWGNKFEYILFYISRMVIGSFDYDHFHSNQPIIEVPDADFVCVRDTHAAIIGLGAVAGFLALLLATIMVIYKYHGDIKVILYFKLGWRPFDRRDDIDILDKVSIFFYFVIHRPHQMSLTHWGRVTHLGISTTRKHLFRWWLVACSAPSHYLNQCCHIVN